MFLSNVLRGRRTHPCVSSGLSRKQVLLVTALPEDVCPPSPEFTPRSSLQDEVSFPVPSTACATDPSLSQLPVGSPRATLDGAHSLTDPCRMATVPLVPILNSYLLPRWLLCLFYSTYVCILQPLSVLS